jgi:hypothetical protein
VLERHHYCELPALSTVVMVDTGFQADSQTTRDFTLVLNHVIHVDAPDF